MVVNLRQVKINGKLELSGTSLKEGRNRGFDLSLRNSFFLRAY